MTEESLNPIFNECPTGWINPCLEACLRDPTTCCLYQGPVVEHRQPVEIPAKYLPPDMARQRNYRCTVCGKTDPEEFYVDNWSKCRTCANWERSKRYHKGKERIDRSKELITSPCPRCGKPMQKLRNQNRKVCEECKAKGGKR